MAGKQVKAIPYGITDFVEIRTENFYYIDKTSYLNDLQKAGRFLFFIRPRRFGKSLFLSMLTTYCDVFYTDRFEELFRGTEIYDTPTSDKGKYLVLPFNFSLVDPTPGKLETSFLRHVQGCARSFLHKYADRLIKDLDFTKKVIEESLSASDVLAAVIDVCRDSSQPVYLIVDEYDNFANNTLTASGESAYRDITHEDGILRTFFNVVKGGTTGTGAPIKRLLITGVSPVTMDDVTSGFNIGHNISLDTSLNQMLGFSRQDVETMLEYYRGVGRFKHDTAFLMKIIGSWYGNYLFSENAPASERLYNTDMVLYFMREYFKESTLPRDLIDRNVRIDYGKLRHLIVIDKGENFSPTTNGNFSKLKQVIEEGETSTRLVQGFPIKELSVPENFKSLLFYFGLLTIQGRDRDQTRLCIPNETIKRLYYDYIENTYKDTGAFSLDLEKYNRLMSDMAYEGKWKPLFEYITSRMSESMALRDLITGEKSIQAFLNVYLGLSDLYIIHAERELNKGFVDLAMEPFLARYEGIKYAYLLEIKYLKAGTKGDDSQIETLKKQAKDQLRNYALDEKYKKTIQKTTLIKLVLIFSGHCLLHLEQVE